MEPFSCLGDKYTLSGNGESNNFHPQLMRAGKTPAAG
jgi:hypothetical protein